MGRSWPSLVHEECYLKDPMEYDNEGIPIFDENFIGDYLEAAKTQVKTCWTCKQEDCQFNFSATKQDGTVVPLHFLECTYDRHLSFVGLTNVICLILILLCLCL